MSDVLGENWHLTATSRSSWTVSLKEQVGKAGKEVEDRHCTMIFHHHYHHHPHHCKVGSRQHIYQREDGKKTDIHSPEDFNIFRKMGQKCETGQQHKAKQVQKTTWAEQAIWMKWDLHRSIKEEEPFAGQATVVSEAPGSYCCGALSTSVSLTHFWVPISWK